MRLGKDIRRRWVVSRAVRVPRRPKRSLTIGSVVCAVLLAGLPTGTLAHRAADVAGDWDRRQVVERFVLPITPPLDQGDSDLCWVYATLSMLETNYKVRHPLSRIALSRGALQREAILDRLNRRIRGEPGHLENGGLAVEALALIRKGGLIAQGDFHRAIASDPIVSAIAKKLSGASDPATKREVLKWELEARLGAKPASTHLDNRRLSPAQLADVMLGEKEWIEFDRSPDGVEGWGPSRDPDARPETRVLYVKLDRMIDLIHRSLRRGEAVVWGSKDHALLIYGGEYDGNSKPLAYWIKDSLAPYAYRARAETIHRKLNDVTVAARRSRDEVSDRGYGDLANVTAQ
jgi:hypothetical protein